MDKLTKEQRHKNMQAIRSKDTKIEILLRKALWHEGIRYRKTIRCAAAIRISSLLSTKSQYSVTANSGTERV